MNDLKNFWFSYSNILQNELINKNYFSFLRKILGVLYKYFVKFIRHKFSKKIENLDKSDNKFLFNSGLDNLFLNFNCDKGTTCFFEGKKILSHNYSIYYEKYLSKLKNEKLKILELGSHEGKGIASFFFYFPNSEIFGANINPFQMKFVSTRITELFVDVKSKKIIENLAEHLPNKLDIIIDDASHNLRDILITLPVLFKSIKSGGYYIIEDMDQFHVFKNLNPYKNELTPKEILLKIKNKEPFESIFLSESEKEYLIKNIEEVKIEKGSMVIENKNISDIAFIKKK